MNNVVLIGRLTKDPQIRCTNGTQMTIARFTLAVDRPTRRGEDKKADFPQIVVFGKQAENCGKFLCKGLKVAVEGRIQTGSYQNQKGDTVYTTDVVANHVEFLEWADSKSSYNQDTQNDNYNQDTQMDSFEAIDADVPF